MSKHKKVINSIKYIALFMLFMIVIVCQGSLGIDVGTLLVLIGVACMIRSFKEILTSIKKKAVCTVRLKCTVDNIVQESDGDGGRTYRVYVKTPAGVADIGEMNNIKIIEKNGGSIDVMFNPRDYTMCYRAGDDPVISSIINFIFVTLWTCMAIFISRQLE